MECIVGWGGHMCGISLQWHLHSLTNVANKHGDSLLMVAQSSYAHIFSLKKWKTEKWFLSVWEIAKVAKLFWFLSKFFKDFLFICDAKHTYSSVFYGGYMYFQWKFCSAYATTCARLFWRCARKTIKKMKFVIILKVNILRFHYFFLFLGNLRNILTNSARKFGNFWF